MVRVSLKAFVGVGCFVAAALLWYLSADRPGAGAGEPPKEPGMNRPGGAGPRLAPVEVDAVLSKRRVQPGEKVKLSETVPAARKIAAYGFRHQVTLVGHYDPKAERLMSRPLNLYGACSTKEECAGLASNTFVAGDKTWPFDIKTDREVGYEFEFAPAHLGIYLITATWSVQVGKEFFSIDSQPVVLVVEPPLDEKGRPKVKPEWLTE